MSNRDRLVDISARIKKVRKNARLTQTEFTELLGISRSYLSEVEGGKGKPNVNMLVGVAKHFPDVDLKWILLGESSPMPQQAVNDQHRCRIGGIKIQIELVEEPLNAQ